MNFYIWAAIVTIIAILMFYYWFKMLKLSTIPMFLFYLLLTMPFSLIVNLVIKKPTLDFLLAVFQIDNIPKSWPLWFLVIVHFIPPITEESIKIYPLLFPSIRKIINNRAVSFTLGSLLGLGFGIGEAWYLAFALTWQKPEFAWGFFLDLVGFFGERLTVAIIHGFMTGLVFLGFYDKKFLRQFILVITIHASLNIGAALYQTGRCSLIFAALFSGVSAVILVYYIYILTEKLRKELDMKIHGKPLISVNKYVQK